jgi:hypothetical protein
LLYTPRGRPVSLQRLRSLVGLASARQLLQLVPRIETDVLGQLEVVMTAIRSARFLAYFFTVLRRFRRG